MLEFDTTKRATAADMLKHPWLLVIFLVEFVLYDSLALSSCCLKNTKFDICLKQRSLTLLHISLVYSPAVWLLSPQFTCAAHQRVTLFAMLRLIAFVLVLVCSRLISSVLSLAMSKKMSREKKKFDIIALSLSLSLSPLDSLTSLFVVFCDAYSCSPPCRHLLQDKLHVSPPTSKADTVPSQDVPTQPSPLKVTLRGQLHQHMHMQAFWMD